MFLFRQHCTPVANKPVGFPQICPLLGKILEIDGHRRCRDPDVPGDASQRLCSFVMAWLCGCRSQGPSWEKLHGGSMLGTFHAFYMILVGSGQVKLQRDCMISESEITHVLSFILIPCARGLTPTSPTCSLFKTPSGPVLSPHVHISFKSQTSLVRSPRCPHLSSPPSPSVCPAFSPVDRSSRAPLVGLPGPHELRLRGLETFPTGRARAEGLAMPVGFPSGFLHTSIK